MPPLGYIVAVNFIGEKKNQHEKKTTTLSKITNKLLSHIHVVILKKKYQSQLLLLKTCMTLQLEI
jgi:hypothetical protein